MSINLETITEPLVTSLIFPETKERLSHQKAMRYMKDVEFHAQNHSKEATTKVGALVIGPTDDPRSTGYNGAVRGSSADVDWRINARPEKYNWISHAEENAICNAARSGAKLYNSIMFTTHFPCINCARLIVQSGIKMVISAAPDKHFMDRWEESVSRSVTMFGEARVGAWILMPDHFASAHEIIVPFAINRRGVIS